MSEENLNSDTSEQTENIKNNSELKHIYYEIESDLLAKPNALVDIIITNPEATVVYCNQPSEADLIEVILKKRGVESVKLIGHVPYSKLANATSQAQSGQIAVVIVTDISAKDLDVGKFKRLVNYSIHEDPEIYLHRCIVSEAGSELKTIINLVSPLDHGNFHYLKKVVDFDIEPASLPSSEEIQKAQFAGLLKEVEICDYTQADSKFEVLLEQISNSDKKEELIKYLAYNYAYIIPSLKSKPNVGPKKYDSRDNDENSHRRGSDRVQNEFNDDEARIIKRNLPKKEYIRFYVGSHNGQNIEKDKILSQLKDLANVGSEQVERVITRNSYSFIDLLKDNSQGLVDLLDDYKFDDGNSLIFKKATKIVVTVGPEEINEKYSANGNHSEQNTSEVAEVVTTEVQE